MAALYHINGDSVSPCRATQGNCPFGQGSENNHFSDAAEAMTVLEGRLASEYGATGSSVSKASAAEPVKTAKELAAEHADPKAIRDALRRENPTWNDRQVHTVAGAMVAVPVANPGAPSKSASAVKAPGPSVVEDELKVLKGLGDIADAQTALKRAHSNLQAIHSEQQQRDATSGATEGRAYYFGSGGKIRGVNPNGRTFFDRSPDLEARRAEAAKKIEEASNAAADAQTSVELAGGGHRLPDEGNTIRVRTQAQKWLLTNELQGQISDGQWENSGPQDHWKDWSNAKVIVDPKNVGRNFRPRKDNYQLNSSALLDVVGDRMVDDVKTRTGDANYDAKNMRNDLADLRKVFKTQRPSLTP